MTHAYFYKFKDESVLKVEFMLETYKQLLGTSL